MPDAIIGLLLIAIVYCVLVRIIGLAVRLRTPATVGTDSEYRDPEDSHVVAAGVDKAAVMAKLRAMKKVAEKLRALQIGEKHARSGSCVNCGAPRSSVACPYCNTSTY